MNKFYLVGGTQKESVLSHLKGEWHHFKNGIILELDLEKEKVNKVFEYISPKDACPEKDPSITFKAGYLTSHKFFICTQTEILICNPKTFEIQNYISLPSFNDIHHVRPNGEGKILVASTGLDLILEINYTGKILREWSAISENTWNRFSKEIDYRKVLTTKPHKSHPNYIFEYENEIWITRFEQKDAISLYSSQVIKISIEKPHDGIVVGNDVFFTSVDGHLLKGNLVKREITSTFKLWEKYDKNIGVGWCRGLSVINERYVLIGFSRLRTTKVHQNINWVRNRMKMLDKWETYPSRVVLFDMKEDKIVKEINIEKYGMNAIFSIHKIPNEIFKMGYE